jgi:hypothetical protein
MKKKLRIIILLAFVGISYVVIENNQYEKFYPIFYSVQYDELLEDDIHLPKDFYKNLEIVLIHYNEDYKKKGEVVYVKKTLYKDKDLCWNYSSKANNKVWLHSKR